MHVRFHHERIRPRLQRLVGRKPGQALALRDHQLVQGLQQIRGEQADIADHGAVRELAVAEGARQTHDAADVQMLAGQFGQAVEVALEALLEQGQHEHDPQRQAGAAQAGIELGGRVLLLLVGTVDALQQVVLEQREDPLTQGQVGVEVLDALEDGRDIVAAAGIDFDLLDRHLVEGKLLGVDDSHGAF